MANVTGLEPARTGLKAQVLDRFAFTFIVDHAFPQYS